MATWDFKLLVLSSAPSAAVGGLSALFHYNLAEQVPGHVWVIVPPEKKIE